MKSFIASVSMIALSLTACASDKVKSTTTTSSNATTTAVGQPVASNNYQENLAAVSDPQIAKFVKTANQGEIDAAKYAKSKTKNSEVKDFANMMIKAHETNDREARALAKKLKIDPADSTASENLEASAKTDMANLKRMSGADLDHAYIDGQVTIHQTVLNSLDHSLIPSAKNPELKSMLQKTRGDVAMHLEHAKTIQENLNRQM